MVLRARLAKGADLKQPALSNAVPSYNPQMLLLEFGNNSVNFEVAVWMDDPWLSRLKLSQLNEAIWWAFQERGIVIASPAPMVRLRYTASFMRSL